MTKLHIFGSFVMSTGPQRFKLSETKRLLRAAQAMGLKIKGLTLNDAGKPTILVDDGEPAKNNELDTWIEKKHANQTTRD
jgi:hypothetical protein